MNNLKNLNFAKLDLLAGFFRNYEYNDFDFQKQSIIEAYFTPIFCRIGDSKKGVQEMLGQAFLSFINKDFEIKDGPNEGKYTELYIRGVNGEKRASTNDLAEYFNISAVEVLNLFFPKDPESLTVKEVSKKITSFIKEKERKTLVALPVDCC